MLSLFLESLLIASPVTLFFWLTIVLTAKDKRAKLLPHFNFKKPKPTQFEPDRQLSERVRQELDYRANSKPVQFRFGWSEARWGPEPGKTLDPMQGLQVDSDQQLIKQIEVASQQEII